MILADFCPYVQVQALKVARKIYYVMLLCIQVFIIINFFLNLDKQIIKIQEFSWLGGGGAGGGDDPRGTR